MAGHLLCVPFRIRPSLSRFPIFQQVANISGRECIGNREVVGYGFNGSYIYADHFAVPFPAIRFREVTPDVQHIKEKELKDWKKLTIDEKKTLYRISFCQTYAEMAAPSGEWKFLVGSTLFFVSLGVWMYIWLKVYVYPPLPKSFALSERQDQLRRMIDLRVDPITGLASKWDYENKRWKK